MIGAALVATTVALVVLGLIVAGLGDSGLALALAIVGAFTAIAAAMIEDMR